jgi:hypothetical protein
MPAPLPDWFHQSRGVERVGRSPFKESDQRALLFCSSTTSFPVAVWWDASTYSSSNGDGSFVSLFPCCTHVTTNDVSIGRSEVVSPTPRMTIITIGCSTGSLTDRVTADQYNDWYLFLKKTRENNTQVATNPPACSLTPQFRIS